MNSGIYLLTFKDGSTYVGKSVNLKNRWQQHLDKLTKGKGASALQTAFDRNGHVFNAKVLFHCHPDYLDLMEGYYIDILKPTLNTTIPENRFKGMDEVEKELLLQWLDSSILDHLTLLNQQTNLIERYKDLEEVLSNKCSELSTRRSREEIAFDTANRISTLEQRLAMKQDDLAILQEDLDHNKELVKYYRRPWWKKLFT